MPITPFLFSQKHRKNLIVLGVALLTGVFATWITHGYLSRKVSEIEARSMLTTISVIVAKHSMAAGETLSTENLAIREMPVDWVQSGAVLPDQFDRVQGHTLGYHLKAGEMLMWPMLEQRRANTFSERVGPGRRAVTLPVDEINSISGMLQPEDRIDLLLTLDLAGQKTTLALMDQVRVMATGQRADPGNQEGSSRMYSTVTLDVASEEAENLIQAREMGKLTALLRHPDDRSGTLGARLNVSTLLAPVRESTQPSKPLVIPVLYGGKTERYRPEEVDLPQSLNASPRTTDGQPGPSAANER